MSKRAIVIIHILCTAAILALIFVGCPIYKLTGFRCPVCGTTRAWRAFFAGDIKVALAFNPFFILFPFFALTYAHRETKLLKKIKCTDRVLMIFAVIMFIYNTARELYRFLA